MIDRMHSAAHDRRGESWRSVPWACVVAGFVLLGLWRASPGGCAWWRGRSAGDPPTVERWTSMGTFAVLSVPAARREMLGEGVRAVRAVFEEIEAEQSVYRPESWIQAVNEAAGSGRRLPMTDHARVLFEESERGFRHSGGAFDPTVGPWVALWGLRGSAVPAAPPDEVARRATAARTGWQRVDWNAQGVRLAAPGMVLDFGGVAKGYAVDRAAEHLLRLGWTDFMVDLGGDLRCHGSARPRRAGWRVAVRDPWKTYGEGRVGVLTLGGGLATATSGNYERFVEIAGRRYAHIVDPRTETPVAGMAQVTVVAPSAVEADVLSTALFVLGVEEGLAMLAAYPGTSALWVLDAPRPAEARLVASAAFLEHFEVSDGWAARLERLEQRPD